MPHPPSRPPPCAGRQRGQHGGGGRGAGAALSARRARLWLLAEAPARGGAGRQAGGARVAGAGLPLGPGPRVSGEGAQPRGDCGGRHAVQPGCGWLLGVVWMPGVGRGWLRRGAGGWVGAGSATGPYNQGCRASGPSQWAQPPTHPPTHPPIPQTSCSTSRPPPLCWTPTPPCGVCLHGTTMASPRGTAGTWPASSAPPTSRVGGLGRAERRRGARRWALLRRHAARLARHGGNVQRCRPLWSRCRRPGLDDEAPVVAGAGAQVAARSLGVHRAGREGGAGRGCCWP